MLPRGKRAIHSPWLLAKLRIFLGLPTSGYRDSQTGDHAAFIQKDGGVCFALVHTKCPPYRMQYLVLDMESRGCGGWTRTLASISAPSIKSDYRLAKTIASAPQNASPSAEKVAGRVHPSSS